MMKIIITFIVFCISLSTFAQKDLNRNGRIDVYENENNSIDLRVLDLVTQMTLEEKIGQMCQYIGWRTSEKETKNEDLKVNYKFSTHDAIDLLKEGKIGSFLFVENQKDCNILQQASFESRLGIPLLLAIDAIHGNGMTKEGGTIYPTEIGMASTFDIDLVEKIAAQTALEMRSIGYHWTFSPNIEVVYDYRWGRCGETFGEDPFLVGQMGKAMIKGYQGSLDQTNILACAKHFVGGGISNNGYNGSPADISERTLKEEFFPPFQEAVKAGVYSIMPAHNEINGMPCHMHESYLNDMIRKDWGFTGLYVSDWMDMEKLYSIQKTVSSETEAFEKSVNAGLDVHMHGPKFLEAMIQLVKEGKVQEKRINEAATIIVKSKFELGLFENRLTKRQNVKETVLKKEHRETALEAARKSLVLLKNNNVLPLKKDNNKIFITGTLADNQAMLGDWAIPCDKTDVITPLAGVKQSLNKTSTVDYLDMGSIFSMKDSLIKEARDRAEESDVVVIVVGEHGQRNQKPNYQTLGENVDRPVLCLRGKQKELIKAVHQSGKPIILVLIGGGPIAIPWEVENVDAIIQAWEPGMYGGKAIADVIFGDVNPSGRLPFTIPRSVGQLYNHYKLKPSSYARGQFLEQARTPLYPFGYGLSYTSFEYEIIEYSKSISTSDDVHVKIKVKNIGDKIGDETVMLYVNDIISSVATPIKELAAFKRISLGVGEERVVEFTIKNKQLSFLDKNMKRIVEAGDFELMLEGSNRVKLKEIFNAY